MLYKEIIVCSEIHTKHVNTLCGLNVEFVYVKLVKLGRFGQQIRNTWKVLKCGAGEGWRRSVGPIM